MSAPPFESAQQVETRRQTRRAWGLLLTLFVLLTGGLAVIFIFHDAPPPDDSMMRPLTPGLQPSNNPLAGFCLELRQNKVESATKFYVRQKQWSQAYEPSFVSFLKNHRQSMAAFERLLSTDPATWQWPGPRKLEDLSFMASLSGSPTDPENFNNLTLVLGIQVKHLIQTGDVPNAARTSLALCRLAEGLQHAHGDTYRLFNATAQTRSGLRHLEAALTAPQYPATAELLLECLNQLDPLRGPDDSDLLTAMRLDYWGIKNDLADVKKSGLIQSARKNPAGKWRRKMIKPNQTLHLMLQFQIPILDQMAGRPSAMLPAHANGMNELQKMEEALGKWNLVLDPNCGGRTIAVECWSFLGDGLPRILATRAQLACVRTLLALRLYELKHQRLPDSLNELSPAFLPHPPVDPLTSAPLLWDAKRKLLYSAGLNLTDDGGDFEHGVFTHSPDWGYHYWWQTPAPASKTGR